MPDAGVRLDRETAELPEDSIATPAPDLVPGQIARDGPRERQGGREPQAEASGPGQGAGTEEDGLSGHRWHELLDDHRPEQGRVPVRADEEVQAPHARESTTSPRRG